MIVYLVKYETTFKNYGLHENYTEYHKIAYANKESAWKHIQDWLHNDTPYLDESYQKSTRINIAYQKEIIEGRYCGVEIITYDENEEMDEFYRVSIVPFPVRNTQNEC